MILPEAHNFDYLRPQKAIAYVHERLLAFFVDVLIVTPFASFLIYPSWKEAEILRRVSPFSWDLVKYNLGIGLYLIMIYFVYETICMWKWSGTFGKQVFYMHVRSYEHEKKLPFYQILMRTFLKCLSFMMLGIPFLEILLHPYRRTFYDLATDSMVLTKKVLYPDLGPKESHPISRKLFYAGYFYLFILLGLIALPDGLHSHFENSLLLNAEYKKMEKCFPMENISSQERLNFLTILNYLGVGNSECLYDEADRMVWSPDPQIRQLAMYAKAVVEVSTGGYRHVKNKNQDEKLEKIEPSYVQNLCGRKELSIVDTVGSIGVYSPPICSSLYLLDSFVKKKRLSRSDEMKIRADFEMIPSQNWVKFIGTFLLENNPDQLSFYQKEILKNPLLSTYLPVYASGFMGFLRMKSQKPQSVDYNRATYEGLPDVQRYNLAQWICLQASISDDRCFHEFENGNLPVQFRLHQNSLSVRVPASDRNSRAKK